MKQRRENSVRDRNNALENHQKRAQQQFMNWNHGKPNFGNNNHQKSKFNNNNNNGRQRNNSQNANFTQKKFNDARNVINEIRAESKETSVVPPIESSKPKKERHRPRNRKKSNNSARSQQQEKP